MRLEKITATPHPDGHRIDLRWRNPDPTAFPGVRVIRRERTHPGSPDDGIVVADGSDLAYGIDDRGRALYRIADTGLRGGRVHYYTFFPYGASPELRLDRANRAAALAGARHGMPGRLHEMLPALYHRYDADGEQLRRFLEMPGGQLDLLWSFARGLLDLYDRERTDGRLLPLLAQWIGWKTDFRLEIDRQRNEIRDAPGLYKRVGVIPVVGATVKRISGWESRSKEFVHNVARSNQPPRLYLRARRLGADGSELDGDRVLSLDYAYGGRPTAATDADGVRWLFYHTLRRGRGQVWHKTSRAFSLDVEARMHLEAADVVELQREFAAVGEALAADATVSASGDLWVVDDTTNAAAYVVEAERDGLTVYETTADPLSMAPSRPFLEPDDGVHDRRPAAALQLDTLWVFWSGYDAGAERWEIRYRTRRDGVWSEGWERFVQGAADPQPDRRAPAAVVDQDDGLWLFWLERAGARWVLRYNRYPGGGLGANPPDPGAWELDPPATFPLDGGEDPRVESEVSVLFHPDDASRRIWVFWARKEPTGEPGQTRWTVAYRVKAGTGPAAADWESVETLPRDDPAVHDRDPCARVEEDGVVTLYWSSDREESWSIWRASFDVTEAAPAWEDLERVTSSPYDEREPLPVPVVGDTLLIHRSSESLEYARDVPRADAEAEYAIDVYAATQSVDFRYAGTVTPHVRRTAGLALRGEFEDFQTYTHDTGTRDDDWYRRDTLGVYLAPDTLDPEEVDRGVGRLRKVLPEFMPATDRAVLIAEPDRHTEHVYTYELPGAAESRFVAESYTDHLNVPVEDPGLGPDEDFTDDLE